MGIIKGLKKYDAYETEQKKAREEREERANKAKTVWFGLGDGESATVRFLQELDEDSPNHSTKNDTGFVALEHEAPGPEGWKKKALCTADEGDCYPCEQRRVDWENWKKPAPRLYVNVLVNPGAEDEHVAVLSQGLSSKSITPTVMEYARDTGSITDREFKISRKGLKTETSWTAVARDKKQFDKTIEDYEVYNLNEVAVRHVPYEEQAEFYGQPQGAARPEASETKPSDDFSTW